MTVRLSQNAEQDLLNIAWFIAADNPRRALSFVDELEQACALLGDQPLRFSLMTGFERLGYRRRPYGRYSIIYFVEGSDILVVRILNAAMDAEAALND